MYLNDKIWNLLFHIYYISIRILMTLKCFVIQCPHYFIHKLYKFELILQI